MKEVKYVDKRLTSFGSAKNIQGGSVCSLNPSPQIGLTEYVHGGFVSILETNMFRNIKEANEITSIIFFMFGF